MYRIENKKKFIGRIQDLLGVRVSGAFDTATQKALRTYKNRYSLGDDHILDYSTFVHLVGHSKSKRSSLSTLNDGDYSTEVYRLNSILSFFIEYFHLQLAKPKGKLYGKTTQMAITEISHHFKKCISREELFALIEYTYSVLSKIK